MPKGIVCDHKYHYFYKITNLVNNKFYYGIRSCDCEPDEDPYMGSGVHLHNAYRKYGVDNFEKEILKLLPTRRDALDLERWIVTMDLVKDPMCYNLVLGGGSMVMSENPRRDLVVVIDSTTNERLVVTNSEYRNNPNLKSIFSDKVLVYDTEEMRHKRVKKSEYAEGKYNRYLIASVVKGDVVKLYDKINKCNIQVSANDPKIFDTQSYKRLSASDKDIDKYTFINDGTDIKRVKLTELDSYLSSGWKLGVNGSRLLGYITIYKDDVTKMVHPDEVESFLQNGWKKGIAYTRYNTGTKEMHKGDDFKYVPLDEVQDYLDNGYEFGGINHNSNKGFIFVTNDDLNDTKMIKPEELSHFISLGYRRGTKRRVSDDKIWVNDGIHNKHIKLSELDKFLELGYAKGFFKPKRKKLNNI